MPNNIYAIPSLNKERIKKWSEKEMAKRYRGKTLGNLPHRGRGKCPLCGRTGIKLLYSHQTDQDQMIQVCKRCRNK
ncbi:hypothetical protein JOD45_000693 [Scopulibacillus daqui]|uniref:HNH endonuclease n=1 Tax=Scopulibacillus daqui TaxID=1469162 RepID=A0ABS2PXR1_9BACL|nr:hypothetical protein [Scopulibacillus daqui]MBM7644500.1 hypothetical protein [Scopulibacillus daqui]